MGGGAILVQTTDGSVNDNRKLYYHSIVYAKYFETRSTVMFNFKEGKPKVLHERKRNLGEEKQT